MNLFPILLSGALAQTPLPAPPPTGWCYASAACTAQGCTYSGVQACPGLPPSTCPAGQQTSATVCWNYSLGTSSCQLLQGDDLSFAGLFQRNGPNKPPIAFPGYQQFAVVKNFDKTKYLALRIDVPATGLPANQAGIVTHGETFPGPLLDVAISPSCGDFNPATSICKTTSTNGGQIAAKWKIPTASWTNGCVLTPGATYYLNVKAHDPTWKPPSCAGTTCPTTLQSNHTP